MEKYLNVFKVLSDKTRLRILQVLLKAGTELCICEIMDSLKLAQYNVSKHIRELKIAGFIKERKEGRFVFYSLVKQNDEFHKQIIKAVNSITEEQFSLDNKVLKKRLSLRKNGKIVLGLNKSINC